MKHFDTLNQLQDRLSEQEKMDALYDAELARLREERVRVGIRLKEQTKAQAARMKRRNFEQY